MVRKTLGRGLQSLLGFDEDVDPEALGEDVVTESAGEMRYIPLDQIDGSPYQPRRDFSDGEMAALSQSIREHGVVQPIVVRPVGDGRFQLIAGERRLRAARMAEHAEIPARVVAINDQQASEVGLIENLQRQDLNPMEKAEAFQAYVQQFGTTHEELAGHLGVDRSTVTNLLRLLELPPVVQDAVRNAKISFGHARAILGINDPVEQIAIYQEVIDEALSVRKTEALVRQRRMVPKDEEVHDGEVIQPEEQPQEEATGKSNHILSLENDLRQRLGTKVEIQSKGQDKGKIVLHFETNDDFERLMGQLGSHSHAQ
ncbi:putative chromosome-partitioning protein ParB [Planctomycetes bacterium Pan216]|uniref:Putative chromosome-partitioning protein ParB n=1 Tax=Kolteria novifilia TaxID=2527975 RepID=A0A518B4D0_9BACT|nr:putative chromosome-partitioning protein ParB [Planctomycetes bacterium Pan216]